jgi:tRNA dimethylallyltransferase
MMNAGWEEEVAALDARLPAGAPAWNATGYRAIRDLVRGVLSREAAIGSAFVDTRRYAKRQRTWFRHQLPAGSVTTIDPAAPHSADAAARWLQRARARA